MTWLLASPAPGFRALDFAPFLLMIVIFWLIVLRPQRRQQAQRKAMLQALKKGDEVVTQSGILGRIVGFKNDIVVLKVDDSTTLRMQRSAVAGLVTEPVKESA